MLFFYLSFSGERTLNSTCNWSSVMCGRLFLPMEDAEWKDKKWAGERTKEERGEAKEGEEGKIEIQRLEDRGNDRHRVKERKYRQKRARESWFIFPAAGRWRLGVRLFTIIGSSHIMNLILFSKIPSNRQIEVKTLIVKINLINYEQLLLSVHTFHENWNVPAIILGGNKHFSYLVTCVFLFSVNHTYSYLLLILVCVWIGFECIVCRRAMTLTFCTLEPRVEP